MITIIFKCDGKIDKWTDGYLNRNALLAAQMINRPAALPSNATSSKMLLTFSISQSASCALQAAAESIQSVSLIKN
ncbi:hypothetical protein T06_1021 [Trichinella sp. T6]|nr:hypothetical protein T06_1021 [Trichinella sp. T6]